MKEVSVNSPPSQQQQPPLPQLIRAKQPGYLDLTAEQVERLISKDPIDKDYDVETEPFARGKYATVRRCRDKRSGKQYAAKFLRKRRRNADLRPEILHEVAVLEACTYNSRIVNLYKVFETSNEMILLLELAPGGELQMVLDRDEVPSEPEVARLMKQILDGLHYLHTINVAHLDIKPQNLVLTAEFPSCDVKLCDFGISRYLSEGADVREILGTPDYVAPEVLNYEPIDVQTDMWSIGVLMYVLLTGCSPFGGDTKQETFCNISQCKLDFPEDLFQDISEEAIDLMKKLMVKNPRDRLTARECLGHGWFRRAAAGAPSTVAASTTTTTTTTTGESPSSRTQRRSNGDGGQVDGDGGVVDGGGGEQVDEGGGQVDEGGGGGGGGGVAAAEEVDDGGTGGDEDFGVRPALSSSPPRDEPSEAVSMTASRRKSFKDNMESLVRRLERELAANVGRAADPETATAAGGARRQTAAAAAAAATTWCRTLSRANGTQTMPAGGLARDGGRDVAPFTFRRVYVVDDVDDVNAAAAADDDDDEDGHRRRQQSSRRQRPPTVDRRQQQQQQQQQQHHHHHHLRPSASSTPNSSSADSSSTSSSASDCSSDAVSEFSIDSGGSDRSSIISLEDSLDSHHASSSGSSASSSWCRPAGLLLRQQTQRLGKMSASCFNVWSSSSSSSSPSSSVIAAAAAAAGKRKWPKECSGAVARAMSQFANGRCGAVDCNRLRVFDGGGGGFVGKAGGDEDGNKQRCVGLELMRERNGNVVVIREIKANGGSNRYARCSELKCESLQSRIRKLQVHKGGGGDGGVVHVDKASNIF